MKNKIKLSIIIPCFNEKKNLPRLSREISSLLIKYNFIEVILVDNGSTDNSNFILKKYIKSYKRLKLVTIKKNKGYGHGIISGLKKSSGITVAWTHSDLQIKLQDLISAYKKNYLKLINEKYVVKGARKNRNYVDGFFTFFMSKVVNIMFNTNLDDINAQPKIFSSKFKKQLLKNSPLDFSLDLFLLLKSVKNDYRIVSFPVTLKERKYGQAKGGGTLWGKIKLIIRTFKYIFKLKLTGNY